MRKIFFAILFPKIMLLKGGNFYSCSFFSKLSNFEVWILLNQKSKLPNFSKMKFQTFKLPSFQISKFFMVNFCSMWVCKVTIAVLPYKVLLPNFTMKFGYFCEMFHHKKVRFSFLGVNGGSYVELFTFFVILTPVFPSTSR